MQVATNKQPEQLLLHLERLCCTGDGTAVYEGKSFATSDRPSKMMVLVENIKLNMACGPQRLRYSSISIKIKMPISANGKPR